MTYKELLEEFKERRVAQLFEYEICTPKIAAALLEKISKLEGEDSSSEEAKEVLKFKDQLKAASEGGGGDWAEPVDDGCMEIFQQIERWEEKCKELKIEGRDVREIEGMSQYVEQKWASMPGMKKLADAVLARTKPLIEAANKAQKDKEQSGVLSELKFTQSLVDGTIATYGMLGFTVPHFIIVGTATPCEQVESKLKQFEEGLAIDPESELGKELATGIEKLKGLMPQMQLICKENPREDMKEAADYKETIRLKGTLMAASACAIKENKEELSKMIEIWQDKAEASLKEDGEASLFEGEAKQKILTKAQYDKALEVLKTKLTEITAKAEKEEKEKAEKTEKSPETEKEAETKTE